LLDERTRIYTSAKFSINRVLDVTKPDLVVPQAFGTGLWEGFESLEVWS
jgi:hypothetical protein